MYPRTPVPSLPSAPLVSGGPPLLQSLKTTSLPLKYPGHIITFDQIQGCCWTATPLLSCVLFFWALYAPALLPLIPSLYLPSSFWSPGIFQFLPARSLSTTQLRNIHPSARCSTSTPSRDSLPPRSSPYIPRRPNSSHLRYRNYIPWHCCRNDHLRPLSAPRWNHELASAHCCPPRS